MWTTTHAPYFFTSSTENNHKIRNILLCTINVHSEEKGSGPRTETIEPSPYIIGYIPVLQRLRHPICASLRSIVQLVHQCASLNVGMWFRGFFAISLCGSRTNACLCTPNGWEIHVSFSHVVQFTFCLSITKDERTFIAIAAGRISEESKREHSTLTHPWFLLDHASALGVS